MVGLPFTHRHHQMVLAGTKSQISRIRLEHSLQEGSVFTATCKGDPFATCSVVSVERRPLGSFTEEDYQREGGYTIEEFKKIWGRGKKGTWSENKVVFVIQFMVQHKLGDNQSSPNRDRLEEIKGE
jgi:hypothetical protein